VVEEEERWGFIRVRVECDLLAPVNVRE